MNGIKNAIAQRNNAIAILQTGVKSSTLNLAHLLLCFVIDLAQVPDHSRRVATYAHFKLLQNNRLRYYDKYKPAKTLGKTAGACLVVEVDATTGNPIRTWYESYDNQNRISRVHPKRPIDLGHIEIDPETGKEVNRW